MARGKIHRIRPGEWEYECLDYDNEGWLTLVLFSGVEPTWHAALAALLGAG